MSGGLAGSGSAQVAAALPAGLIAVRVADVSWPGRTAGAGALVAPGGRVTPGEMLVLVHPVMVGPAVAGRDEAVQDEAVRAGGWLPDHARLGELERHLGKGVSPWLLSDDPVIFRLRQKDSDTRQLSSSGARCDASPSV